MSTKYNKGGSKLATLSQNRRNRIKKQRIIISIVMAFTSIIFCPYVTKVVTCVLENKSLQNIKNINFKYAVLVFSSWSKQEIQIFAILECFVLLMIFMLLTSSWTVIGEAEVKEVIPGIITPVAVGQGQHGTSRFLTKEEKERVFCKVVFTKGEFKYGNRNLGLVLEMYKKGNDEIILCIEDDRHSVIIGATRSGKSRRAILQTIWLRSLVKKSMVISDPKAELYLYSHKYLESVGINTIAVDFREPLKSVHYNYMLFINNAVDDKDIPKAIDYTWDLVSVMVGVPKGEPLWSNGESAVIAAGILVLAMEAPKEFRNLTNVYYFLANMCKENKYGELPIDQYFKTLPETHPARGVFAVAELSPSRTRGSFFGSALATLRLFTNWNIADMTSKSDFDVERIGMEPTALFIIIPDEKTTLYSLVSLMISQIYVKLVEVANSHGGRVPCEVEFELDEFGNFPEIPGFGTMLSVGAGRGLRFNIVLQDYQQLEKKYKEDYENIKGNCQNTLYLKSPTLKTQEDISKRTGTYTVQVNNNSSSVSSNDIKNVSYSDSASMQSRELLKTDEVGRIKSPYALDLHSGDLPAIMNSPDLSAYYANQLFGLGDEDYNEKIIMERNAARPERERAELKLWGIWKEYAKENISENTENKTVSFLDFE